MTISRVIGALIDFYSVFCFPVTPARSVVSQSYHVQVHDEYVLLGNAAMLRCLVPSFVSDYVAVDGWIDDHDRFLALADHHGTQWKPSSSSLPLFNTILNLIKPVIN